MILKASALMLMRGSGMIAERESKNDRSCIDFRENGYSSVSACMESYRQDGTSCTDWYDMHFYNYYDCAAYYNDEGTTTTPQIGSTTASYTDTPSFFSCDTNIALLITMTVSIAINFGQITIVIRAVVHGRIFNFTINQYRALGTDNPAYQMTPPPTSALLQPQGNDSTVATEEPNQLPPNAPNTSSFTLPTDSSVLQPPPLPALPPPPSMPTTSGSTEADLSNSSQSTSDGEFHEPHGNDATEGTEMPDQLPSNAPNASSFTLPSTSSVLPPVLPAPPFPVLPSSSSMPTTSRSTEDEHTPYQGVKIEQKDDKPKLPFLMEMKKKHEQKVKDENNLRRLGINPENIKTTSRRRTTRYSNGSGSLTLNARTNANSPEYSRKRK